MYTEETGPLLFEATVVGKPTPKIKWFKGPKQIKDTPVVRTTYQPETGTATLELLEPTPQEEAVYRIEATNKFGKAECRVSLQALPKTVMTQPVVMQAPKFTKPVKAVAAKSNEDIVLEAEFEGTPLPEVEWFRNSRKVESSDDFTIETKENKTKLKISKKAKQKAGKYEVRAVNPKGEARSSGSVLIEEKETKAVPPRFIQPIKPQTVAPGETVIMEAVVEAVPLASFQWYYQTMPLQQTEEFKIVTQDNKSILLITEVPAELSGPITCRAENIMGSVTSTATINVLETPEFEETTELEYPRFVQPLTPTRVMDGQKVTFKCVVTGKPIPKVQWYHNDLPVHDAKDTIISQDSEGVCSLTITEAFPENAGEYVCFASNKVGEAVCKSTLIVEAYEYVPDSEIGIMTGQSGSEEDLLDKVWLLKVHDNLYNHKIFPDLK